MTASKDELRTRMKLMRQSITPASQAEVSNKAIGRLINAVDWKGIASLHTYIPLPSLKEIDTFPLLKYLWQKYPEIITVVVSPKSGDYTHLKIGPATRWRGIYPESSNVVAENFQYDLILVPTLGFDCGCNRLGWGGGFYDRFLTFQKKAVKVGLAYDDSHLPALPVEPHDVALNFIVTESYTYRNDSNSHKNRTH